MILFALAPTYGLISFCSKFKTVKTMKTTTLLSSLSLYLRRQKKKEKSVKRKVKENAKNLSLRKLTGRMTSKSQFTMHL